MIFDRILGSLFLLHNMPRNFFRYNEFLKLITAKICELGKSGCSGIEGSTLSSSNLGGKIIRLVNFIKK